MIAMDPAMVEEDEPFDAAMGRYVSRIESCSARDPSDPPRYPGRREGELWEERRRNGVPVTDEAFARFRRLAGPLGVTLQGRTTD